MKVFILEDSPHRMLLFREVFAQGGHTLHHAATVDEAKSIFDPPYDILLLDHDLEEAHYDACNKGQQLGESQTTGLAFVRWLVEQFPDEKAVVAFRSYIHSYNFAGRKAMRLAFIDGGWDRSREMIFGLDLLRLLRELVIEDPSAALLSLQPDPQTAPPA